MTVEPGAEDLELTGAADPQPSGRRQVLRYALGVVVGTVAIWLVASAAGGVGDAVSALRDTNPWWLLPALAAESVSYLLSGLRFRASRDRRRPSPSPSRPRSPSSRTAWAC